MTIAIAIRTGSTVVFAADSKITTRGIVGYEEDGSLRWQEQTFDNATKVVHDRSQMLMAIVAGNANIGQSPATDFISTQSLEFGQSAEEQDQKIAELVAKMVDRKRAYWEPLQVPAEEWPGPTLLLAAPRPREDLPRVWRVKLEGAGSKISEILTEPGITLEGSYDEVFTLLYGFQWDLLTAIRRQLEIDDDRWKETWGRLKVLRPIDKLSPWAMPVQDAIEMAVFLATVQVEMDRFLPGTPACGGPIDVMVLQMAPEPKIITYPGKVPHHPRGQTS